MGHAPVALQATRDARGQLGWQFDDDTVKGATISDCGLYRWSLTRDWTPPNSPSRPILWIGMNPSTADDKFDDPTCRREVNFSKSWGFSKYIKGNMLGYRSTDPTNLPFDPNEAEGPENREHLLEMATQVEAIILCYGNLPSRYHEKIGETVAELRKLPVALLCLGKNQNGSAKHPLYLSGQTLPQPY